MTDHDFYAMLRPPRPTPGDELCACGDEKPVILMGGGTGSYNPVRCISCNKEVPPERLKLEWALVNAIAFWHSQYYAIDRL